jgi:hypothetical protein
MSNLLQDERVKWIRQRVVLSLDVDIESFNDHFKESLERARAAGIAKEKIEEFLSDRCGTGSALFFSSHSWEEEFEGFIVF